MTKLFYICDTTMSTQGVDVTRSQFNTEVLTKAPMLIDGEPILFDIKTPQMLFSRKGLEPYVDETTKAQLISQPLPSIYPMARTIFVHKKNIYRFEHKFRKFLKIWQKVDYFEIKKKRFFLQPSNREHHLTD